MGVSVWAWMGGGLALGNSSQIHLCSIQIGSWHSISYSWGQTFLGLANAAVLEHHQGQISNIQALSPPWNTLSASKLSARRKAVLQKKLRGSTKMENIGGKEEDRTLSILKTYCGFEWGWKSLVWRKYWEEKLLFAPGGERTRNSLTFTPPRGRTLIPEPVKSLVCCSLLLIHSCFLVPSKCTTVAPSINTGGNTRRKDYSWQLSTRTPPGRVKDEGRPLLQVSLIMWTVKDQDKVTFETGK